jgi:hypothetical protein
MEEPAQSDHHIVTGHQCAVMHCKSRSSRTVERRLTKMKSRNHGLLHRYHLIACFLAALLLSGGHLVAEECLTTSAPGPINLRGERIPIHEVFETFLLHASVIHEAQGPDAYRAFLSEYGLNPELKTLHHLPAAIDELERGEPGTKHEGHAETPYSQRVGEVFARVIADIRANDPKGRDAEREFRLNLLTRLQPKMSWIFIDENPDFQRIDEEAEQFEEALLALDGSLVVEGNPHGAFGDPEDHAGDSAGTPESPGDTHSGDQHAATGKVVKLSTIARGGNVISALPEGEITGGSAEFEWRTYKRSDGSVRTIALVDSGSESLSLVDITHRSGEHLRDELQQEGEDGVLRFSEFLLIDESLRDKSHTSLACIAAGTAAAVACVACALPPDPLTCGACAAALVAVAAACNGAHCVQTQCNFQCVQACHLYGLCSSTSGSSTPLDCHCVGIRDDTPGCGGGPGCGSSVSQVSVLSLDGGDPLTVSTDAVALSRLEKSDVMHHGDEVSYLMGEWAVLAYGAPASATKSSQSVRTLRSSSPEFAVSQEKMLAGTLTKGWDASLALGERISIVVATPPHEANSRQIPMPSLKLAADGLPLGVGNGKVAIRADFSEEGLLQDFEILHDTTLSGVSPSLAAHIEKALSLERVSSKEHRVVVFAVLSVGESLKVDSSLVYLPKCCCGTHFCV